MALWHAAVTILGRPSTHQVDATMRQLIDLGAEVSVDHDLRESCVVVTLEASTAVEAAAKSAALITDTFITPLTIIGIEVAAAEELDPPAPCSRD